METLVNTALTKTAEKQRAGGAPRGNKNAIRHALYYYKRLLSGDGLKRSTALYRALAEKERELVSALGGDPSPQEQAVIADTVKTMLFVGSLDAYLMQLKSLVRKGRVHGVLIERTRLAAHLRENLKTIGLKRVKKELSLQDYLAGLSEGDGDGEQGDRGGDPQAAATS